MLGDYGESNASLNQRDRPIVLVGFVDHSLMSVAMYALDFWKQLRVFIGNPGKCVLLRGFWLVVKLPSGCCQEVRELPLSGEHCRHYAR